jgi:capsular exopolysaccharide synthesis family protein
MDPTLKSPQDIETFLNLPYLGFVPKNGYKKQLITDTKRTVPYIQSYQQLSDHLYLSVRDKNLKSVLVTADSPFNGLATIVANLGIYLSDRVGYKVLVIDANLRTPEFHDIFHIPDSPGLIDVLDGKISLEKAIQYVNPNLAVLPTRKTLQNPISLLNSSEMLDLIKKAKEKYEIILVDYANLKNIKEVCILSSYLDGIALIVNEGKTRRHVVKALLSPLERKKANLIGVILNNRTFVIPEMIYKRL